MKSLGDVVKSDLCCGCGACAYWCPDTVTMIDDEESGRRPKIGPGTDIESGVLQICPGVGLAHAPAKREDPYISELRSAWGPVLGVWEGYASDPAIRFAGSSGGAITALSLYCLEVQGLEHVLHTAARQDVPYLNETVVSRTREDLMRATGSRYAPASPCEGLHTIEDAKAPCLFVGKPCDVAAAQMARKLRPGLDEKLGLAIAFFCAGTPSTRGTLEMLKRMGVPDPESLVSLRYRGNGWPGMATAVSNSKDGVDRVGQMTYEDSWGSVLSHHQQWRCKLCADHTGEFADIAVGDPWYHPADGADPGRSLILARTERGRDVIVAAAKAGYLTIVASDSQILPASQPNLLRTRGAVWGRILACRLMGIDAPRYINMPMFVHWWRELSLTLKAKSIGGTLRRIRNRARSASRRPVS